MADCADPSRPRSKHDEADPDLPVIVVTGSSGFIGYALCERFKDRANVIGLDRPGDPHPPASAHCVEVDLTSADNINAAFAAIRERYGDRIAAVYHLAAYYDFSGEPSEMYDKLTVKGTELILDALRPFTVDCFVFSSTMLVHAPCDLGERITETSPIDPKWAYPASKVAAEEVIRRYSPRIPSVLWRVAGVYDDGCHSLPIAQQIQRIFEKQFTSYFFGGNPNHGQSFIHLDDVIDMAEAIFDNRASLPSVAPLLAGEEDTMSYRDLQMELGRLIHGRPQRTVQLPKFVARLGAAAMGMLPLGRKSFIKPWMMDIADDHYAVDMTRAKRLLGWKPRRLLRSALGAMVTALEADPAKFYDDNGLDKPSWLNEWKATRARAQGAAAPAKQTDPAEAARR